MVDWRTDFYEARWHLDAARRMFAGYDEYKGKRFLVGVIREGAKSAGKLVRAFLVFDNMSGGLLKFKEEVAPKYLDSVLIENLVSILLLERDQKRARVEFVRCKKGGSCDDEILFEVDGNWKGLKISRLREFIDSVDEIIRGFPADIKR